LTWGISRELDPADVIAKPFTIIGDDPRCPSRMLTR